MVMVRDYGPYKKAQRQSHSMGDGESYMLGGSLRDQEIRKSIDEPITDIEMH